MIVKKAELAAIAVRADGYPPDDMPEVAFAGRSNVGKSSLLNLLTGRKRLAKVSGSPGKTRTINFYVVNDAFRIVDLPGYGYAKLSRSVSENWGDMVETYLKRRKGLALVVLLADIRHKPSAQDAQLREWLRYRGLNMLVAATKADKISHRAVAAQLSLIRETLALSREERIVPVSALKRTGVEELLAAIEGALYPPESEPCAAE
ncbi:MAG: ribosome biogenesis GTP-binding protein YihA/YsxC [Clostridiales Family XIII bacterium]|jgi:GTP-binding protein|nr:ribosome biogenesis GTP-binding protein YihA/YsxC [Clostridiales Family XIII bacterium]